MAGQAAILSKFLNKTNRCQSIIYYDERKTGSQIDEFYPDTIPCKNVKAVLSHTVFRNFDIAHIHSAEILVPIYKWLDKKVVLHYHGSDINEPKRADSTARRFCRDIADIILYNDRNMVIPTTTKCVYFPDVIDTEHFHNSKKGHGNVTMVSSNLDKQKIIEKLPPSTVVYDIDEKRIPYADMPRFLSQYSTYVDFKITNFGKTLFALSNTGLQALACGLEVIHNGKTLSQLPYNNTPDYIIPQLQQIYEDLVSGS